MPNKHTSLREMAKRYAEIINSPEQQARRLAWARHNSFDFRGPLIYIRAVPYWEFFDYSGIGSTNPLLAGIEREMAELVQYHNTLCDDTTYEPWIAVPARFTDEVTPKWGVPCKLGERNTQYGAAAFEPVIREEGDFSLLRASSRIIDEEATKRDFDIVNDAIGDILDVVVDRKGLFCGIWAGDISTDLAKLRGLEEIMWDAYDNPDFLHKLCGFMRDAILADMDQTEQNGNFSLFNNQNQAMPYAMELAMPDSKTTNVRLNEIWGFMSSQEFTTFSPAMFDEFMLSYQKPIMEKYGLTAYGCCEDLTKKIDVLKKIKNLRRIAVSPFANVRECAERIGKDYVVSYRPNPSMIAMGLDEAYVKDVLRKDFAAFKDNGSIFDVTLKDVETIAGKPANMLRWVELVREVDTEVFG